MNRIVPFNPVELVPDHEAVLQNQGISKGIPVQDKVSTLVEKAIEIFIDIAVPDGLISELSKDEFYTIFEGEGNNADDTPLEHIFPQADSLALFALTLGNRVSEKISNLFEENDFALGAMLDTVASMVADSAVAEYESYYFQELSYKQLISSDSCVLNYSPGYCGWHISGQKKLFRYLKPEQIGILLNDSFLMIPLKSVTGVLVAGKQEIHVFKSNFPFCPQCKTFSCHTRMRSILGKARLKN